MPAPTQTPTTPWPWPTPPSTTASPSATGSTTNANKPDATRPPTPATRPSPQSTRWNPPWDLAWQRAYTRARTTQARPGGPPADVRAWTTAQHTAWNRLRPEQQQLLAEAGITPRSENDAGQRRRTSRVYPPSPGLAHARTYALAHGHLSPSADTHHDGFPLGRWLVETRRKARQGQLAPTTNRPSQPSIPGGTHPGPTPGNASISKPARSVTPARTPPPPSSDGPNGNAPAGPPSTPSNTTSSPPSASFPYEPTTPPLSDPYGTIPPWANPSRHSSSARTSIRPAPPAAT
uniref:helicase associated domain-containing protein n=1 Tax=Streptomyces sp. S501 TaxID=2420135 RepID=UPI001F110281|nr:helicase associated domain-containing protein [Streptomyces sp. S501]